MTLIADKNKNDYVKQFGIYVIHKDYSKDMSGIIGDYPPRWADINLFKQYCMDHLDAYLKNNAYDTLAVCGITWDYWKVYTQVQTEEQKDFF